MPALIYLDYHATTPCDPRVVQAMIPYFSNEFGNPSSTSHRAGHIVANAVDRARQQVADLIQGRPNEIIFTSGATESNNLAILGVARGTTSARRRIVTTAIEHKAVLQPCIELRQQGFDVVILPVDSTGKLDIEVAREAISEETLLVSIQAANNEIGTLQDIAALADLAHERGAILHTDAAQAVGKIPVDVNEWDVDLLSISAHKLYGPKGVGALYVHGGAYAQPIHPLFFGGGQQHELRPGTLNVPGIIGLGEACQICAEVMPEESMHVAYLRDLLESLLLTALPELQRNGALDCRLPGNSSLTFLDVDAETLIANVPRLALSTGSACMSGAPEPSHVLLAIGLDRKEAYDSLRVGLGRFTTEEELRAAIQDIVEAIDYIRRLSTA
jgi:cysteine desulfurase